MIAASIREFGWTNPVLIDESDTIIAGHGRLMAAKKLKLEEAPCIVLGHLTDAQRRAYILADNQLALAAGWDEELLAIELQELQDVDFPLDLIGFGDDDLDRLLGETDEPVDGLTDPDAVPEAPAEVVTQPGDIWIMGDHRLMCGDSTDGATVEALMDGERADMVFTDPPYNIDYGNIKHPKFRQRSIENDNMSTADFDSFCSKFSQNIAALCDGCVYVFGPPGPDGRVMFGSLDDALHCSTTIIWNKDNFTLGRGKYQNKYEPCWFGWTNSGKRFINDRTLTNVWEFDRPKKSELHPTMKPVELVEYAIGHASKSGDAILDLFGGSGSTLIACEKTGRQCRMMELDPRYCDVIVKRWQDFTGKTAHRVSDLKTFRELEDGA